MQHTLVAVFDNRADAQSAMEALVTAGFSRQDVRVSEGTDTPVGDGSITSDIKHFFADLFGTGDAESARKYSEAVKRGRQVLTVVAMSEPEIERAADLIEPFGPVDIDEQAAQKGGGAMSGEAMRTSSGTEQQSAPQSRQGAQGSSLQGSQQRAAGAESTAIPVIGEQRHVGKREVERGGMRVFQRVIETVEVEQLGAGDTYYRSHFDSNYASTGARYEDYTPAYTYGSTMAGNTVYRGRAWDEVEPTLRSGWETRNPGSTWENIKAAVRHGWDKITS